MLNVSESAVSQHLKILREADLIIGEKVGYYVHYNVRKNILDELKTVIEQLANGTGLEEQKQRLGIAQESCDRQCKKHGDVCGA